MSAIAPRTPVTRSTRQHRRRALAAVSLHHSAQAARSSAGASAPQSTDLPTAHQHAKVKPWQVALGFLALLCSGIDLG